MRKTARIEAVRTARIVDAASPDRLEPEQIRIVSRLSGISAGTEMAVYRGEIGSLKHGRWGYWTTFPIDPGYELVGTVVETGALVSDVGVGDRVVALAPHTTEAVVVRERYVKVPDEVSDESATFAILGATTTHGMRRAGVRYGETVLVLGLGVVGLLSAMHARRSGAATVIVADPLAGKRSLASRLGFEHVLDPGADGYLDELDARTRGHRADVVIEASGSAAAFETCLVSIAHHGRLLVQGTHLVPVPIDFSDYTMHYETTIISTWAIGSATKPGIQGIESEAKENLMLSMELIRRGDLDVREFVSHRYPFEDLPSVYEQIDTRTIDYLQVLLEYGS
jgi:2-desacetyl-2-hydroxyethyl bacteriochlorophyllide A dehydrogenase